MNFLAMSDKAVFAELGQRIQKERLNQNMAQGNLALKAGVSRRAVQYLETGRAGTLASLIRVLRTLGKLDALDSFLPQPGISPVQLAKLKGAERRRATGQRGVKGTED
jgi:transcriptional regulator with XRE-family HTH domain